MDETDDMRMTHRDDMLYHAYSAEAVRTMEGPLLERGVPLMRMAATATAQVTAQLLDDNTIPIAEASVVLLAGSGDNGGDGLYAAAELAREGAQVTAIAVGKSLHLAALLAFTQVGGKLLVLDPDSRIPGAASGFGPGEAGERLEAATDIAREADVILDAMTGIGIDGALRGLPATLAQALNPEARHGNHANTHSPLVVAVDTPSGVGVDDGALPGACIPADVTVMFGAMKACAMLPPAMPCCGRVALVDFGFKTDDAEPLISAVDGIAEQHLRRPHASDDKYSRGVVGLATGSGRYPGAAVLSSRAAARSNVGMIRYVGPAKIAGAVMDAVPEAVCGKGRVQSWAVGSGVADGDHAEENDPQRAFIKALLSHYDMDTDGDEAASMPPICVDAGALDLLPRHVPAQTVLTPHSRELTRLLRLYGEQLEDDAVDSEPLRWSRRMHELTGATVLLKGAITIVVGEHATMISGSGPAWLAVAGAGDVLSGMTGALLAQQGMDPEHMDSMTVAHTVASASYIHGLAAGIASGTDDRGWRPPYVLDGTNPAHKHRAGHPIIASDVIAAIPAAIGDLLSH